MTQSRGLEGTVIDQRYELVELLGAGSFASVWRATQVDGAGEVALKILSPEYTADPELVNEFINDAKAYVAFRDEPNIATILDCGHDLDTGFNYVAMTLLGSTLAAKIASEGALSVDQLFQLARDLGNALRAIHGSGQVHRDIKSSNVLFTTAHDRFVLSDFAVGVAEDSAERTAPTMDISRGGAWGYASPEKIQGLKRSDQGPGSDFYSLGVVLFEAATGRLPFDVPFPQIINAHLKEEPPDPRTIRPDLPEALANLILRCLQKRPERRFLSPSSFLEAVQMAEEKPDRTLGMPFRIPRSAWIGLLGILGVVVLGALVWFLIPKGKSIEFVTSPDGADYRIYEGKVESRFDAIELGTTPAVVKGLHPGSYTVVFEKDGYFSEEARFDLAGNNLALDVMVLHPMEELRVESDPPGAFATLRQLSGRRQEYEGGRTPVDFRQLRSGPHELILRLDNFATQVETVRVGREVREVSRSLVAGELRLLEMFTDPPGAEVFVTGISGETWDETDPDEPLAQRQRVTEVTPCRIPNLKAGQYRIEFSLADYLPRDTLVTVLDSLPTTTMALLLERDPSVDFEEPDVSWPRKDDLRPEPESESKPANDTPLPKPEKKAVLSPAELAEAQAAIRKTLAAYERALENRSVREFSRLWISMGAGDRAKFERAFSDIQSQQLEITESKIDIDGDVAAVYFHEVRVAQPATGRKIKAERDRVLDLQRIGSGEWLISGLR